MRICLFDDYRLGVVEDDQVADITPLLGTHDPAWPWPFVPRFIRDFDDFRPRISAYLPTAARKPLAQVRLRPPVPAPFNIAAAAVNYRDHASEMDKYQAEGRFTAQPGANPLGYGADVGSGLPNVEGRPSGRRGEIFLKSPTSIIGPNDTILLPDTVPGTEVHHEGEFAAVIQRECYRVSRKEALSYVFGYMGLMDITVR